MPAEDSEQQKIKYKVFKDSETDMKLLNDILHVIKNFSPFLVTLAIWFPWHYPHLFKKIIYLQSMRQFKKLFLFIFILGLLWKMRGLIYFYIIFTCIIFENGNSSSQSHYGDGPLLTDTCKKVWATKDRQRYDIKQYEYIWMTWYPII